MTKLMIDFENDCKGLATSLGMEFPKHTQEALEGYLLHGWRPGGFLTAMLALDLGRAVTSADMANRHCIWLIGRWILEHAPRHSFGSYDAVENWVDDNCGRRTAYKDHIEKQYVWKELSS